MGDATPYRRGDVLLLELPFADVAGSKARPVLVVQNDTANQFSGNLIVVAISSRIPAQLLPVQYKVTAGSPTAQQAGLLRDSLVDCGIIYTIARQRVRRRLGSFPPAVMSEIDRCLHVSLALP